MTQISALLLLSTSLLFVLGDADARNHGTTKKVLKEIAKETRDLLAVAPKDNETCFSPDEPCSAKLAKFIETAKESLDVAIFEMTDQKIAKTIAEASTHVKVRMVLNPRLFHAKDSPCMDILRTSKAEMRPGKQKGIMHNKFTIVDGKRIETGSFNYTYGAGNSNQENQIYLSTPSALARYQERFEKMWKEAKH